VDGYSSAVDAETRAYLDQILGALREDVSREVGTLRQEFGAVRGEFGTLRREFGTLRGEFGALRQEMRDTAAETRRHFDVVAESLRHDIRGIAEGVIGLSERVDRLDGGLRTEMNERFAVTHAVVRVAFQEVRRDIEDLRTSL
jgi:methyl-accepting chemotaxis protein